MDFGLGGRVALVSGAYRGTGAGIAAALAAEGASVAVHGFEAGQADAVVARINAAGGRAVAVHGDLMTEAGADEVVEQVDQLLGAVEVLVNNYGVTSETSWDMPAQRWHEAWERNVLTGVRLAQRTVATMRTRGWGRVVFLGTLGTARPGSRNPDYYGAKAALPAVVRSMAKDLRGTGVTVNVVSPGLIATSEVRSLLERGSAAAGRAGTWEAAERWGLEHVMGNLTERIPDPDDIGRVVAFVAGDVAWHINGADIRVDGGALDA
ncbi:MAG TPA: SDR family oxidoreductase [Acidimicrobiales bacterium]|nr:SDR family oxidoreductase [Acidimicrobiales bacterium]